MSFRIVPAERAGAAALGILVPPGTPTVLIVRPRSLNWDLLLVRGAGGTTFQAMNSEEASLVARGFFEALQEWARGRPGLIQAVADADGFLVWADVGDFCLVVCERRPGQAYRPLRLTDETEARRVVARLTDVLHPPEQADQEVYFNTHHFRG